MFFSIIAINLGFELVFESTLSELLLIEAANFTLIIIIIIIKISLVLELKFEVCLVPNLNPLLTLIFKILKTLSWSVIKIGIGQ